MKKIYKPLLISNLLLIASYFIYYDWIWGKYSLLVRASNLDSWKLIFNETFSIDKNVNLITGILVILINFYLILSNKNNFILKIVYSSLLLLFLEGLKTYTYGPESFMKVFTFYLIFYNPKRVFKGKIKKIDILRRIFNKISLYSFKLHLASIIFMGAFAKISGNSWINGTALFNIIGTGEYCRGIFCNILKSNKYFVIIFNYFIILFQYFYPILVWNRKWRIPLVLMATLFHLGVALVMGLYGFLIVCPAHYVFLENKDFDVLRPRKHVISTQEIPVV